MEIIETKDRKIAFYDPTTGLFYKDSEEFANMKFSTLDGARLYADSNLTYTILDDVNRVCTTPLQPVYVEITRSTDLAQSTIAVDSKLTKLKKKFEPLDAQAKADIEAMSNEDYAEWRKLRKMIGSLEDLNERYS